MTSQLEADTTQDAPDLTKSTTAAESTIHIMDKPLVTDASLFVSDARETMRTDDTNTDVTGQPGSSVSGQNGDFTSGDTVTIGITEGSTSSPITESTTTWESDVNTEETSSNQEPVQMMTTDSFTEQENQQQTTNSESTWQSETVVGESQDAVTTGHMQSTETQDSEGAELKRENITLSWSSVTIPTDLTAEDATGESESVTLGQENSTSAWMNDNVTDSENQELDETMTTNWVDVTVSEQQSSNRNATMGLGDDVTTESASPVDQTTASTEEGDYTTDHGAATDNDITTGQIADVTHSNDVSDETGTEIAQDTTDTPTLSVEFDHVTTRHDASEFVTKSTQKRSVTDQPTSSQTSRETVAAPEQHTSNACANLRYIWNQASVTREDADCAIDHYVSTIFFPDIILC